ncbi:MAG: nucleotidyltransferase family protein [Rubrivivax sp.]|nr:nucleotidyltransferase family protein [Rubrivivax sp.]
MTTDSPTPPAWAAWLRALREPEVTLSWSLAEWQRVVRLARRLRLLARLAERLQAADLLDQAPAPVRRHLLSEMRLSRWRTTVMVWTLDRVAAQLEGMGCPLVLLKGGAYIGQGLPIARGRLPSDVDILVPHARITEATTRLLARGWGAARLDDHDQRYYQDWSHEVPPMNHPLHPVELDLHHNILPPVARTHVDAGLLLARLQPSKWPAWQVLHPVDQVLHSAAHLFLDSELQDRVRDLVDLDALLRHFGTDTAFWRELPERARQLGLAEPLALASHFTVQWLGTPIPAAVQAAIVAQGPSPARRAWLLPLMAAVLTPTEPDARPSWRQDAAALAVLARYHRQRMPLRLLLPHLWHKMRTRNRVDGENTADVARP